MKPDAVALDDATVCDRTLVHLLAGRAAEETILGSASSGAGGDSGSDLARATLIAATAVSALGLDPQAGLLWRGIPQSTQLHAWLRADPELARRTSKMLERCYAEAKSLVVERRKLVELIAAHLLEMETIEGEDVIRLLRETDATPLNLPSAEKEDVGRGFVIPERKSPAMKPATSAHSPSPLEPAASAGIHWGQDYSESNGI